MIKFSHPHRETAAKHCKNTTSTLYSVYSSGSVSEKDIKYLLNDIRIALETCKDSEKEALQALYDEAAKYDSFTYL